ncbi:TonB-dependent receptor [Methylobacterium variabile]|jgi:iron complex outermembrane recepter protein|uniref:TonB-dependent receptor n=1 Tax=Methylobacterium variabile TaxID=298794 RepID=A0A0J6SRU2_9HYPH|nr:TonB-dependent siderophore receptor [Methylobacterium variabile]KMO37965.1 TonB-dependent receptor [Methylobacterium variabile]
MSKKSRSPSRSPRRPAARSLLLSGLATGLAGAPALAQETIQLNEISVAAAPAPAPRGIGAPADASATSGGGGGPSGVQGYTARVSPTATKTNTPLIETPQSVSVVTREQLNDRNVQTLNEAINYTPGVASNVFGYDPRFDAFYIRGFNVTNIGIYRDGLRQPSSPFAIPRVEPYGLDAITILRGPAGGLYGLGSPGGIVDLTSKRPTAVPFGEVWLQRGNYDRYQGNFDLGGPVEGSDGQLLYRVTGLVRQSSTFLPGSIDDRAYIAPALTWRPSADTSFTLLTEYLNNTVPGNTSFYSNYADPRFQKTRIFSGDPAFQNFNTEQYRIGYAFEHKFTPDIVFRQNFRYYHVDADLRYTQIDSLSDDLARASRSTGHIRNALDTFSVDNQLEIRGATGPVQHDLVAGIDYTYATYSQRMGFGAAPDLQIGGLVRPNYGAQFIPVPALGAASRITQSQLGTYVQDQAKLGRFILTLTGRHDSVATVNETVGDPTSRAASSDRAFSGRVGLNYLLTDDLVPYVSYATTFAPQLGLDRLGNAFQPTKGDQLEGGVKFNVPGTSVFLNMAVFDITQTNVLVPDPVNPILFTAAVGEVNSHGAELEVTANLGPGINVTAAYSHVDIRTTKNPGSPGAVGLALSGIPGNTFRLFATYAFPTESALSGLSFGGGVRYAGTSPANDMIDSYRNSTVTLFDAVAAYDFERVDPRLKGMRLQVNVSNLLDRNYFNCQAGACYRGQPRQVLGSLIYRW